MNRRQRRSFASAIRKPRTGFSRALCTRPRTRKDGACRPRATTSPTTSGR
jgi:hypothetical protein